MHDNDADGLANYSPLGPPGQRLWIAETYFYEPADYCWEASVSIPSRPEVLLYKADFSNADSHGWQSPATMPQHQSRSTAVHLGSRLVRVQEVTVEDAVSTGCYSEADTKRAFARSGIWHLWVLQFKADHGQAAWDANVWVWLHRIGRE